MQNLLTDSEIREIKTSKLEKVSNELKSYIDGCIVGELIECPECHYISKNKRGTCKVFDNAIKCFCCGFWRKL